MDKAETPLWQSLDAVFFPFRALSDKQLAQFGSRDNGWSDGLEFIEPELAVPFLPGLAHGLVCHRLAHTNMAVQYPEFSLFFFLRAHPKAEVNFAETVTQLSALFGAGEDVSSTNTRTMRWKVGFAGSPPGCFRQNSIANFRQMPATTGSPEARRNAPSASKPPGICRCWRMKNACCKTISPCMFMARNPARLYA